MICRFLPLIQWRNCVWAIAIVSISVHSRPFSGRHLSASWIMPMAVLSLMAMPFGLETWPLKAMGFCIDLMVDAGIWVSSWPGAVSVFLT